MGDMPDQEGARPFLEVRPEPPPVTDSPLLHTKLRTPVAIPTLLTRPRLISQLSLHPNGYLTLLSAPAGFGKTTLALDWIQQQPYPAAWLTLDEQDNDPILFWRYLVAAVKVVDARLGARAQAVLASPTRVSLETAVTLLINDLLTHLPPDARLILVLDDFHWIHNAAIHQSLNYLLQHQPPQLHLMLLTRADPPLSLARLRVEGRLLELRAADLRLTPPEIAAFFSQKMALNIPETAVDLLAEQTEGWAAGLQLAALAALTLRQQGAADVARLVQTLAGARQHIFAYLMEEVLRHQPAEERQFLQQTAVLPEFCPSLCTAVTGQPDAARLPAQLAAKNLFITPLDETGEWYRYHPLFAEMLRANLDEATQRECHRRAAAWFADHQYAQDAIRHAQAAQDYALMADLLGQTYKTFLAHGLLVSVKNWFSAIPPTYQTPRIRLISAWARVYESNETELHQIVADITAQFPGGKPDPALQGEMLAVQAIYASLYGHLAQAIALAQQALPLIAPTDYLSKAAAHHALGNAYRLQGDLNPALAAYAQARQEFDKLGRVFMAHLPLYRMAHIQVLQGRLHQALQTYETVRQHALAAGAEPVIASGEIFGYLSDLYCEWNELEKAVAYAEQEIELAQMGHFLLALVDGYLKLAAAKAAQGEVSGARQALTLAMDTAVQLQSAPHSALVAMEQARHDLAWGNLAAAVAWAAGYAHQRQSGNCPLQPLDSQTAVVLMARIWLAQGHITPALDLLQEMLPTFETAGRIRLMVEAHILQALGWTAQAQPAAARQAITHALTLAQGEGYIRVFIENGATIVPLLTPIAQLFPDYVPQLLALLPPGGSSTNGHLLDPLTERELEILRLIALGCSNYQVANQLVISVGTVKGHVNHILSKLDAQSRTQAVARARELHLLAD